MTAITSGPVPAAPGAVLVQRRHVDLARIASALCRLFR
ncbi:putative leader peptide [Salinactinospora qingdaonensis]